MYIKLATLAILAQVSLISTTDVCAQQAKSDPTPNCNSIHLPSLHDIVQGGTSYIIRWDNNTGTSVSLVLCQGPSADIQEIGCIVDHAPNTGSFVWHPATNLVPDGNHNYGLKIIADTGDFQWSDQFGISNSISTISSSIPSTAPIPSKKTIKESAKAAKETASTVKLASDGQIQEPTGTIEIKQTHTKNISNTIKLYATGESMTHYKAHTHTKNDIPKPSATSNHLSAHLVHNKGSNTTYIGGHSESHILPSITASSVKGTATKSVNEVLTPTIAPSVPTTLPSTTVAPSSSLKSSFSTAGAARTAFTGAPLVLGAMVALVL